jgi:diacylglycerol kinase (ATP)
VAVSYKFILNPAAANGKCDAMYPKLEQMCLEAGIAYEIARTEKRGQAQLIAREAAENFTYVVAVGGDGTIHEVVNGLIPGAAKLGILPVGTGNDLIRGLGIPNHFERAFHIVVRGDTRFIDVGKMGDLYFHNGIGVGFDAWVAYETLQKQFFRGKLKYLAGIFKTLYKYNPPEMTLMYDKTTIKNRYFMINIANGLYMGGGFKLTPFAEFDDGELDLNIVINLTKLKVFKNFIGVFSGKHTSMPEVTQVKARKITISSDLPFAAQADGEFISADLKKVEVTIIPRALEIAI